MTFFEQLDAAIARNRSLLCVSLDPNPEFLPQPDRPYAIDQGLMDNLTRSLQAQIAATADLVCAYKPTLELYLALGAPGLALLESVLAAIPPHVPVILDAKHANPIASGVFAHTAFERWQVGALTLVPFAGQDHAVPFLLEPERAIFALCHTANPSARRVQDFPTPEDPYYLHLVREIQTWGVPEQVGLEVELTDPAVLAQIRAAAPERSLLLRGVWSSTRALQQLDYSQDLDPELTPQLDASLIGILGAGLRDRGDGVIALVPRSALSHPDPARQVRELRDRLNHAHAQVQTERERTLATAGSTCPLWLPDTPNDPAHPHADLIVQLYELGCIMFGDYVQASGARFPYYIDLRQIISTPQLFHKILLAYAAHLEPLTFDRIAGIPYGSLPTATGLSLHLHRPMIFPRKEVKAHGTQRVVEGNFHPGETAVVVDDILISGNSAIEGAGKLESVGLKVTDIVVLIDHGRGVKDRLRSHGYTAHAVITLSEIAHTLHDTGHISTYQLHALLADHAVAP